MNRSAIQRTRLWNETPVVVRELRQEHGSFGLLLGLFFLNLVLGDLNPHRLQRQALLLGGSLLGLQTLRAAQAATVQERQVLALTTPREFVDGWARLACRPLFYENWVAALVVLALALGSVALIPSLPPGCSIYPIPLFKSSGGALARVTPFLVCLPLVTLGGAYLGLLASAVCSTKSRAGQFCLFTLGLLAALGWVLVDRTGTVWSLALAALPVLLLLRHGSIRRNLVINAARLLLLGTLLVPPFLVVGWDRDASRIAALLILAMAHAAYRARQLPSIAMLLCLSLFSWGFVTRPYRVPARGSLPPCKSGLRNVATALEMYSADFGGQYPSSLGVLTPNYLKTIPECPSAQAVTYQMATALSPPAFTLVCAGGYHRGPANFPQYSSRHGLLVPEDEPQDSRPPAQ